LATEIADVVLIPADEAHVTVYDVAHYPRTMDEALNLLEEDRRGDRIVTIEPGNDWTDEQLDMLAPDQPAIRMARTSPQPGRPAIASC
jgi:hypothetical protein